MITQFKYVKTLALGNIDKRHQYETETFEAVSDVSFDEAKEEVLKQIRTRYTELVAIRDRVSQAAENVATKP